MNLFTIDTWSGPGDARLFDSRLTDLAGLEYVITGAMHDARDGYQVQIAMNKEGIVFKNLAGNRTVFLGIRTGRTMSFRPLSPAIGEDLLQIVMILQEDMSTR
jgi:hypothetical protein